MKTILVCNQKGGVGKSLVADEIAFSFERSGIPVSFYDLDTQGGGEGTVRRGRAREASEERAHAAPCQGGRAARAREDAEVGGQGRAVRRVAEKMREQRQAAPFSSSRSRATKRPSKGLLMDVHARGGKSGFSSSAHL